MKCNTCQNERYCYDGNHQLTRDGCADNGFAAYAPQINADRIRAMSDEELAIWLSAIMDCSNCVAEIPCAKEITTKFCKDILCEWLKSPVEVQDGT